MILEATCRIAYTAEAPVAAVMMLRPRSGYTQWITREEYVLDPHLPVVEYTDKFGNLCQRILIPPGKFEVRCRCRAYTADACAADMDARFVPVHELPESALEFLHPSRYCQSDLFTNLANTVASHVKSGYPQAVAIDQWLREQLKYVSGSSNENTSAVETNTSKEGVCRDFAHLGIALCRALYIPARMVVGYLHGLEPMDLHAWFEAYVGDRWYTFDPSQKTGRGNRIVIGTGRDAADVALTSYYGPLSLDSMEVTVDEVIEPTVLANLTVA